MKRIVRGFGVMFLVCSAISCGGRPDATIPPAPPEMAGDATPGEASGPIITLDGESAAVVAPRVVDASGRLVVSDFESMEIAFGGSLGVYGGAEPNWDDPGPKSWFVMPGEPGYGTEWVHTGRQSFRIKWKPDVVDWASFAILLGPFFEGQARPKPADLSAFRTLTFWARGEKGGEEFQFVARSASAADLQPDLKGRTYRANPEWTRYEIDLQELFGENRRIEMVGLRPGRLPLDRGTIYTDDWSLTR